MVTPRNATKLLVTQLSLDDVAEDLAGLAPCWTEVAVGLHELSGTLGELNAALRDGTAERAQLIEVREAAEALHTRMRELSQVPLGTTLLPIRTAASRLRAIRQALAPAAVAA